MRISPPDAPAPRAVDATASRSGGRRAPSAYAALAAVAVAYVVAQLVVFTLDRPLSWDEVVYLSQTAPGEVAMDWVPQRARGMAVLVAPVALVHAAAPVVRAYLVVLSGLGLFLAFRPWVPLLGRVAAVAAGVFGFSWVGLYFGMEVFPNLPAAFAAVAAAGSLAGHLRSGRRRPLVGVAVGVAILAVFRPADSVWLAAGLTAAATLLTPRRLPGVVAALAIGGVVGWLPWLVEATLRYGNPLSALRGAEAESLSSASRDLLDQYLNLVEGPVSLIVTDPTLTYRGLALLVGIAVFVAVALTQPRLWRRVATVATVAAVTTLLPYLVLNGAANLRYLLPAWALTSVAVAVGLAAVARTSRAGRAVVVVLIIVWGAWQAVVASGNAQVAVIKQRGLHDLGAELQAAAGEGPCAFVSEFGFPQLAWTTDCIGLELDLYGASGQCPGGSHDLATLARRGYDVFALARSPLPADSPLRAWESRRAALRGFGPWRIYRPKPGLRIASTAASPVLGIAVAMPASAGRAAASALIGTDAIPRLPDPGEASVPCPLSRAPAPAEIAPLRIGPRLPGDTTTRRQLRRLDAAGAS